jgi:hypothetical protein
VELTEKKMEEHGFLWESMEEAVAAALPQLTAASQASHKLIDKDSDDPQADAHFDRMMARGQLLDEVVDMCGPKLWVLLQVAQALNDMADDHYGRRPSKKLKLHA